MKNNKTGTYLVISDHYQYVHRDCWIFLSPDTINDNISMFLEKDITLNCIIFDKMPCDDELRGLFAICNPYTVFYTNRLDLSFQSEYAKFFFKSKQGVRLNITNINKTIYWIENKFYKGQYGHKLDSSTVQTNPGYHGSVEFNGFNYVQFDSYFGNDFMPVMTFCWGITGEEGKSLKVWLDYEKNGDLEIRFNVYTQIKGSTDGVKEKKTYSEYQLKEQIELVNSNDISNIFNFSIDVRGSGKLIFRSLHYRWSRQDFGEFLPGGKRLVDNNRQELFYYFHPGDLKGPLNVYFSGWRQAEGFEGWGMMNSLGAPFLLFSDPRLEGGCFFRGSEELENKVTSVIIDTLKFLGLSNNDLNISGISMGSYAALYYGAILHPHSIIIGKPIFSLHRLAQNEGKRFGVFPASLDILNYVKDINHSFVDSFGKIKLGGTKIMVAYMEDDDYDDTAYQNILKTNRELYVPATIVGKGYSGRHNDSTNLIIKWFTHQFRSLLEKDFMRRF